MVLTVNVWYLLFASGCLHRSYVAAPPQVEPLVVMDCSARLLSADGEGPVRLVPMNGGPLNVARLVVCEDGKFWQGELGWAQRVVPVGARQYLVTTGDPHVRRTGFYLVAVDETQVSVSYFRGPPVPFVAADPEPGVARTARPMGGYTRWCVTPERVERRGRAR